MRPALRSRRKTPFPARVATEGDLHLGRENCPSWAGLAPCGPDTVLLTFCFDQSVPALFFKSSPRARNSALRAEPGRQASAT